jgi:menaquinone-9 beta-reductase
LRHDITSSFLSLLREVEPGLAEGLRLTRSTPLMVFRGRPGYLRIAHGPGWALVGDAGFFRDPATAHGITDALRDAEGLADAILRGTEYDLRRFQSERDEVAVPLLEITDNIAGFPPSMDQLQALHKQLNLAMKAGVAGITARQGTIAEVPLEAQVAASQGA